jgi:hypothetical protein
VARTSLSRLQEPCCCLEQSRPGRVRPGQAAPPGCSLPSSHIDVLVICLALLEVRSSALGLSHVAEVAATPKGRPQGPSRAPDRSPISRIIMTCNHCSRTPQTAWQQLLPRRLGLGRTAARIRGRRHCQAVVSCMKYYAKNILLQFHICLGCPS